MYIYCINVKNHDHQFDGVKYTERATVLFRLQELELALADAHKALK